jgi:ketosteroid isomerase-like protein
MADVATLTNEVESFYRAFLDGFNREDTDMYLRSFSYPNGILSGDRGLTINAKESDLQRFYQEVMSSIQSRGWDHTGVTQLQAWPIAENMAFLLADISRYKKDKSILESGRYLYTVRKDGGAWKVLTLTEVKPPFTGPSASQEKAAEAKAIVGEIEIFYRDYIDGFNKEDQAAFIRSYAHPHAFLLGEQGMIVTATVADHERSYQRVMADLHKRGWGKSVTDQLQIWPLTTATALIIADVTRYKKDQAVLEKLRASYTLQKESGAWKFLTVTEIKAPFSGPGGSRP